MLNTSYTFEVLLFSLINFAPFVFLSIFTFQKQLRFSKKITYTLCVLLIIIQFATRYWNAAHNISFKIEMSILRLIIFVACYILLFEVHWGKVLFVELIFENIGNFIIIAAVCLERNMFPNIEHRLYCWHTSIAMIVLHLFITLPYTFTLKKYFKPMVAVSVFSSRWAYYWLVPAIFYSIWQYQVNGGPVKGLDIIIDPFNVIFFFLINIGSYLIYQLIIQLDSQLIHNYVSEKERRFQDIETMSLKMLEDRIFEARRARHDVKHHMIIIEDCLNSNDYDRLKTYVRQFHENVPENESFHFCNHHVINILLLYYGHQASELGIDFQVDISISDDMVIADSDISIILSNLLENAIHACKNSSLSDKCIIIHGTGNKDSLFFTIDNSYDNQIIKNKKGQYISTKSTGSGVGIESVKHIVSRYNGMFTTEYHDNMFYVSFMLNL